MTKVALLIGVSEYESGLNPLPSAVLDVDALHGVLVDPERGDFLTENIKVLKNPDRQQMEEAIYWLSYDRRKEDLLLFYFSGHGIKDDRNNLYLGTRITQKDNRGSLFHPSAVAATYLHERIESSGSQRQVIILDSCFSGAIAQGMTVKDDGAVRLEDYLGGKGRAILTSSTATEYSFGAEATEAGSSGLSIYTGYLVEGIVTGAADLDEDDWISVDELHEYASKKVRQAAPAMTPKFYPVEEGYKIRLAKSRRDDPQLKYQREVQKRAEEGNGKFSIFVRKILSERQREWRISPEIALMIEDRVLQPYREYQRKLTEYEQTLSEAVEMGYPFSDLEQADLKEYQQHLKLRDEDIAQIDRRVKPPDAIFTPVKPPPIPPSPVQPVTPQPSQPRKQPITPAPNPDRRNFIKWVSLGGTGAVVGFILPEIFKLSSQKQLLSTQPLPTLSTIEFASVKLNDKGTIVDRPKGQAKIYKEDLGNDVKLTMVKIPAGEFLMGSPTTESERFDYESQQHQVKVAEFYLGQTLVTQAQWQQIMGNNPSNFRGDGKLPVEQVSWLDTQEFCQKLSQRTQRKYRLPSEAEWEYACRARTTTPFYFGNTISSEVANYSAQDWKNEGKTYSGKYAGGKLGESRAKTTPVGNFPPNGFGLYDLHGNLWEWCLDHWYDNYKGAPVDGSAWVTNNDKANRAMRGGSWYNDPRNCRSASRAFNSPDYRDRHIGFRVVCEIPRTS